jgi:hypothetical protein
MQDVQRALQLKARRESRAGGTQLSTNSSDISPRNKKPYSPSTGSTSPARISFSDSLEHATRHAPVISSDIDFSPAVRSAPLHPVPTLVNNGRTLDWSGSSMEEGKHDKLWRIPTVKRKEKEKDIPPSTQIIQKDIAHHAGTSPPFPIYFNESLLI